ncbi:hypothetical protein Aab01nite_35220 [Paractinoplanes abujensis]|uniref:Intradiol ring-cleavage dioxygenases domain-containing protein n=1 Tax=Paractinoplanes abujensis TaxID=882441 RepID=A0A7W7D230_9ACTN|nr:hypothetical protein [Actinoplanes abujensis]MBB4697578.1 hypothetical protein [Actinoplanes abujensis]GID19932.1 hypothetical protein Aab01nite_35220 [Actinoplanes abujensis]
MTTQMQVDERQQHGVGLAVDFPVLRRRRMMGLVNGVTVATLAGADKDVLSRSGIVRGDLRRSFGKASGVARGVPLRVRLRLVSANSGRPLARHALYLWHADRDGAYSLHSPGLADQNYLRGVQMTDKQGWVGFTTVFPGAGEGRWPHLSFEVRPELKADPVRAGQIGLPADACVLVYGTAAYWENATHLALARPVEDDGGPLAMATVTGDLGRGLVATRTISI